MSTERDATRIVQSWLESGSTAIPDRVVDAVLAELPSRRQRRSRWSSWRVPWMKPITPLAAGAAVVVLAVVLGMQFLPGDSGIAGPTSSPVTPSASPTAVGGQFTFADVSIDMDASSDGSTLSGTVVGSYRGDAFTIELQCLRQFDGQTWMLAGMLTESAVPDQAVGSWAAVIVRDGSPQQAGIWTEAQATADDCEEFVSDIPDSAVDGQDMIGPIDEGSITLPPAPASNDVSGQVTFPLGDTPVTVEVAASADGAALSGTAVVSFAPDEFTIALECSRQFDDTTWILGGTTTESTTDNSPVGTRSAVLVRDGEPQELILWFEDPPPADDCAGVVNALQDDAIVNAGFVPATEGEISLP
jgi:hypothetical protein